MWSIRAEKQRKKTDDERRKLKIAMFQPDFYYTRFTFALSVHKMRFLVYIVFRFISHSFWQTRESIPILYCRPIVTFAFRSNYIMAYKTTYKKSYTIPKPTDGRGQNRKLVDRIEIDSVPRQYFKRVRNWLICSPLSGRMVNWTIRQKPIRLKQNIQ